MPAILLVIDVQQGFRHRAYWGPRDNPDAEANITRLVDHWRAHDWPVVLVQHDSVLPASPLRPGQSGNDLEPFVTGSHALHVRKTTNSAFYGTPDLHAWLSAAGANDLVICGITTNHCCETTARMAGNLGYDVRFVLDATFTHDRQTPDGDVIAAAQIGRVTAANLHGEFATVCTTEDVLGS